MVAAAFHASKPVLYIASSRLVRAYDLASQTIVKKFESGAKNLSCLAVHPRADHLIVGALDPHVSWFDSDLSSSPYQTLR